MEEHPYSTGRDRIIRPATLHELAEAAKQGVPPLERGLILPLPEGAVPAEGTIGIPQVAQRYEVSASGLVVPSRAPRAFADIAVSYLSLRMDFSGESTEQEVIGQLKGLPLRQVLWVLAEITHWADKALGDTDTQARLCRDILPASMQDRALGLVSLPSRAVVSPQVSLGLALRALVHCKSDQQVPEEHWDGFVRLIGLLVVALGDQLPPSRGSDHLALEVARTELFFKTWGHMDWYAASYELFFETLPRLRGRSDWIDVDEVLQAAFGVSLEDFWAITVSMGIAAFGQPHPMRFPMRYEGGIDGDVVARWEAAFTIDLEEARALAEQDLAAGASWLFRPFMDRPILDAGEGLRFLPRPHFLAEKGGLTGMFWAVSRALKQTGGKHKRWATLFGHAVEAQARRAVADHLGDPSRVWHEKELEIRWGPGRVCDLIAVYPDAWVAFEFRHRVITRDSRATGDLASLHQDLQLAAIDKFGQIDNALGRGLGVEPLAPRRIFPIVVLGSHFPTNPHVARAIADEVATTSKVLEKDPRCRHPAVLDIYELSNALEVARQTGQVLPDVLEDWLGATGGQINFRAWLSNDGPGVHRPPDKDWLDASLRKVFGTHAVEARRSAPSLAPEPSSD